ncbi:hypothetical protein [Kitasatospora sp. NPDC051914]|uniref:hypothetical protein n=1 Tax=Kitasatospora sp. NPDC051914 TaxID=3154945 RepID=UPI00341D2378
MGATQADAVPVEVWHLPAADTAAGRQVLAWTVGPGGGLAVLLGPGREQNGAGRRPGEPFDAELLTADGRSERRSPVRRITVEPDHLALLPGGRLLLASYRSEENERQGTWAPNAAVHTADGDPAAQFCLGDDVRALTADRAGRIWTVYGDEGVYGEHRESQDGLAGWNARGQHVWSPPARLPERPLEGCAAATDGPRVWLAWYSDDHRTFLTRIDPGTSGTVSLPSPVHDPMGMAVRGNRAVLAALAPARGRRSERPAAVEVCRAELADGSWRVTDRRRLPLPAGLGAPPAPGRDGSLWLRSGATWLCLKA